MLPYKASAGSRVEWFCKRKMEFRKIFIHDVLRWPIFFRGGGGFHIGIIVDSHPSTTRPEVNDTETSCCIRVLRKL